MAGVEAKRCNGGMDTLQSPYTEAPAVPEAPSSFPGWLMSSVELMCGVTVTQLALDLSDPGWREVFGLATL